MVFWNLVLTHKTVEHRHGLLNLIASVLGDEAHLAPADAALLVQPLHEVLAAFGAFDAGEGEYASHGRGVGDDDLAGLLGAQTVHPRCGKRGGCGQGGGAAENGSASDLAGHDFSSRLSFVRYGRAKARTGDAGDARSR
jgi:hypothetical protein